MRTSQVRWDPVSLSDVRAAQERTRDAVLRTPLAKLDADDLVAAGTTIWLKLENLQPVRSFKLRGAWNQIASLPREQLGEGVWTVSSGNMAQSVAWSAQRLGIAATIAMPESAPQVKVDNVRRYGGNVVQMPLADLETLELTRQWPGVPGTMIHPFSHPDMMAGNGVIALEIVEDLPEVDAVIAAWGGGGLSCGIAPPLKALRPGAKMVACQGETGNPLPASFAAGKPVEANYDSATLADGIAGQYVPEEMFALAQQLLDGAIDVPEGAIADAIKLLAERTRIIAEGAAAITVAAAMSGKAGSGNIVCIISGGNIDMTRFTALWN